MFPFKGSFPLEELYNVLQGQMHQATLLQGLPPDLKVCMALPM